MENEMLNLNILKKYVEDNRNKINDYKEENDSTKLKNNLFLNLNVPIPSLNRIIDESKNMIINNSYDEKYNSETSKCSRNILDIIKKIPLKKKNCFQRNLEYEKKKDTNENDNIIKKKKTFNDKEREIDKNVNIVENKNVEDLSCLHNFKEKNMVSEEKEEKINYYPGFCKQLGAKGRRCMLELIRKAYRENTPLCKNVLSHKIKPSACISNLPFFNINMLWKLAYEFGVFEEALKIHKIYGQNANPLNQYLNKGNSDNLFKIDKNKDTKKKKKKNELFKKEKNSNNKDKDKDDYNNDDDEDNSCANIINNINNLEHNMKPINNTTLNNTNIEYSKNKENTSFSYEPKINNNNEKYNKKKKRKRGFQEYELYNKEENEYVDDVGKQETLNKEQHKFIIEEFNINKCLNNCFQQNAQEEKISLIINNIKKNLVPKENLCNNLSYLDSNVDTTKFFYVEEPNKLEKDIKNMSNGNMYFKICNCNCHHKCNSSVHEYSNEMLHDLYFNKKCKTHKINSINNKLNESVINEIKKSKENKEIINGDEIRTTVKYDNSSIENVYELNFLNKLFYNFSDNNAILLNINRKNIFTITCKDNIASDHYLLIIPLKKNGKENNSNKIDQYNREDVQNSNSTHFTNQKDNFNYDYVSNMCNNKLNGKNPKIKEQTIHESFSELSDYISENEKVKNKNINKKWQSIINEESKNGNYSFDPKLYECLSHKFCCNTNCKVANKSDHIKNNSLIKNKSEFRKKDFENINSLLNTYAYNKKNSMGSSHSSLMPTDDDSTTYFSNLKKKENYNETNKTSTFLTDEETNNNVSNDCIYSPSSLLTISDSNKFAHNNKKEYTQEEKENCKNYTNDSLNSSFHQIIKECITNKKDNTIKLLNEIMSNEKNFFNSMKNNNLLFKRKTINNANTDKYYNDNKKVEKKDLLNFLKQRKMNNTRNSGRTKSNYIKIRNQKNANCEHKRF